MLAGVDILREKAAIECGIYAFFRKQADRIAEKPLGLSAEKASSALDIRPDGAHELINAIELPHGS